MRVTPRPPLAGPARHRRAWRGSLTCGNATDRHRGAPSQPPGGSLTIHGQTPTTGPPTAMRAAADAGHAHGQLGDDSRGETLPPGSHATTRACHWPVASSRYHAWTVPSWRSSPTATQQGLPWSAAGELTTMRPRSASGLRKGSGFRPMPPAAMTDSVPQTRTGVRESGWRLEGPRAASESEGSPTANRCVAPAIGLRQQRSVGSLRLGGGLALSGRAEPQATPLTPPAAIARTLANRPGESPGDRCGSR
jgi:hypothetical protein